MFAKLKCGQCHVDGHYLCDSRVCWCGSASSKVYDTVSFDACRWVLMSIAPHKHCYTAFVFVLFFQIMQLAAILGEIRAAIRRCTVKPTSQSIGWHRTPNSTNRPKRKNSRSWPKWRHRRHRLRNRPTASEVKKPAEVKSPASETSEVKESTEVKSPASEVKESTEVEAPPSETSRGQGTRRSEDADISPCQKEAAALCKHSTCLRLPRVLSSRWALRITASCALPNSFLSMRNTLTRV